MLLFQEDLDGDSLRRLAVAVMETCQGRCAVYSRDSQGNFKYAIGQQDGDLRDLVKEMNQVLCGRGGGKPFFVQGSVRATREEIEEFWKKR